MKTESRTIILAGNSQIKDIQNSFAVLYPFLMIEFFYNDEATRLLKKSKVDTNTVMTTFADFTDSSTISISGDQTVSMVVQDFIDKLGIHVKMYRKSGSVWNAISLTDEWTLERQNAAGEYICSIMDGTAGEH